MENFGENQKGRSGSHCSDSTVAYTELVPICHDHDSRSPTSIQSCTPIPTQQALGPTSSKGKLKSGSASLVGQAIQQFGLCPLAEEIILASWRNNTQKRYHSTLEKWNMFCVKKHINPLYPDLSQIINFLTLMYKEGRGHRAICAARSALNAIIDTQGHKDFSMHPLLTRFCKGVFNLRPPPMKQQQIWDPRILLDHIDALGDNNNLTLQQLSYKTVCLVMLLSGSRVHCIHAFSTLCMQRYEGHTFYPTVLLKHSRPKFRGKPITYKNYPHNPRLCVVRALDEYIKRKTTLASSDALFLTHRKPHKPAHRDTIARWLKDSLKQAGINNYTAHSYRAASTSLAFNRNLSIKDIMQQGQWTAESTWSRYYQKEIIHRLNKDNFSATIQSSVQ